MNEVPPTQSLSGSRIGCLETAGRLMVHLPARPLRMVTRFGGLTLLVFGFLLFVIYASEGWLPVAVGFGAIGAIILTIAFATMAGLYLMKTSVLITTDHVVLRTVLYGKEKVQQYALSPQSRARQWYLPQKPGRRSKPQGVEIGPEPYDPEAGSDLKDETRPRFGAGLSRGEMDWVEWRINQVLDKLTDVAVSEPFPPQRLVGVPGVVVPRPEKTKAASPVHGPNARRQRRGGFPWTCQSVAQVRTTGQVDVAPATRNCPRTSPHPDFGTSPLAGLGATRV